MGYLIDTCIWIDIERGKVTPAAVAAFSGEEPVYLSPITIAELKYGAEISRTADIRQKRLAALARLKGKPVLWIDESTGEIFGDLAVQLKKTNRAHSWRIQDLWIASQAIQHNFKLLTNNKKDFVDIPGLLLVVWDESKAVQ